MGIIANYVMCTLPSNSRAHQANVSVYSESFRQFVIVDPTALHAYDFVSVRHMNLTDKLVLRGPRRDEERVRAEIEEHVALQTAYNIRGGKASVVKSKPCARQQYMITSGDPVESAPSG